MSCCAKKIFALILTGLMFLFTLSVLSWGKEGEPIGSITAIEGEVYLSHKGDTAAFQAMLADPIYLYDHIQTETGGRVQILFQDESLLNLAENTYIQITEHIYSPEENRRSVVIRMLMGKVRGIVGRHFTGPGSKYVISTPSRLIKIKVGCSHFIVDASIVDETELICIE